MVGAGACGAHSFQSTLPAGGATNGYTFLQFTSLFQSTLPAGGATLQNPINLSTFAISIHAPRGGSDQMVGAGACGAHSFQSTLPAGGATAGRLRLCADNGGFQSTLPAGGAT